MNQDNVQAKRAVRTILIVDDEPLILSLLSKAIDQLLPGSTILTAPDGKHGLEILQSTRVDAILVDYKMPGIDGIEFCRRMNADERTGNIPALLMTGYEIMPVVRLEGLEAGALDFLNKPIDISELSARLNLILKLKNYQDELESANSRLAGQLSSTQAERDSILDNMQELMVYFSVPDLNIIWANKTACAVAGVQDGSLEGKRCYKIWHDDDQVCRNCPVKRALDSDGPQEDDIILSDGRIWTLRTQPVRDEKGRMKGVLAIGADVTGHRKAVDALRESEKQFRELFLNMSDGVAIYEAVNGGEDFIIRNLNPAGLIGAKLNLEDIINRSVQEVFPGIVDLGLLEVFRRVWKTGEPESLPARLYEDQRLKLWVENYVFKISSGEIVAVYSDITERKKAEQQLQDEAVRRRILFERSRDGIAVLTLEGGVFDVNESHARMIGYTREEMLQLKVWDWDDEWTRNELLERISNIDPAGIEFEARWRRKDSTVIDVGISANEANYAGQRLVFTVCRDITERKKSEQELERISTELRELSKHLQTALEEERKLIAREIHDELGQALTALKIDLSLLEDSVRGTPEIDAQFGSVQSYTDTLIGLVNRIALDLRPTILDDFGLVPAIEWQVEEFQRKTGIKCSTKLPKEKLDLEVDIASNIYRIVQETLTNIMRHSQADQVRLSFSVGQGQCRIDIADNGRGFDKDKLKDIKSIGLIGMRERALSVGGTLTIGPGKKGGTTVRLTVPLNGGEQSR